jgi:hypothetical protein
MPDDTHEEFRHAALAGNLVVAPVLPFLIREHKTHGLAAIGVRPTVAMGLIGSNGVEERFPFAAWMDCYCDGVSAGGRRCPDPVEAVSKPVGGRIKVHLEGWKLIATLQGVSVFFDNVFGQGNAGLGTAISFDLIQREYKRLHRASFQVSCSFECSAGRRRCFFSGQGYYPPHK